MNTPLRLTFILVLFIELRSQVMCFIQVCNPGTFLYTPRSGPDVCMRCTEGVNFMSEAWHTNRACFDCTQIQDPDLEILVTECNMTHDAVIMCRPGFYRHKARNSRQKDYCKKCYECENPTLPCHDIYDTVCCGPEFEAVLNKDGVYVCKELPILCQRGQYLVTSTEQCRTCPSGTYMTEISHNKTACNICQTLPNLQPHQVILQTCNSAHPTIIGCDDGYFSCRVQEQSIERTLCLPYITTTTVCGEDQHLSTNLRDKTSTCLPCKLGTYMDKLNHTLTVCKNCTEFKGEHLPVPCGSEGQNQCKIASQLYTWPMLIVTLVPVLVAFSVMCYKRSEVWAFTEMCNMKLIKLLAKELINAYLVVVCMTLVTIMFSLYGTCWWCVMIMALIYILIGTFTIIIIVFSIVTRFLDSKTK